MLASMGWAYHTRRTEGGSANSGRTSPPLAKEEIGKERHWESAVAEHVSYSDLAQRSAMPLFLGFEALAQRRVALFEELTPLHEKTALLIFIGLGITDSSRYEDATAAFNELRRMAPTQKSEVIQVFTRKHREASRCSDFLYLHFAGDPLTFGLLICALTNGGLMAGWQLSSDPTPD